VFPNGSYPDARIDTPEDAPTLRDLSALAWSLDLEADIDEQPSSIDAHDGGRRA
jgi:hypothetical protein